MENKKKKNFHSLLCIFLHKKDKISGNSTEVETPDFSFHPAFTFPFTSTSAFVLTDCQDHTKKNKGGQTGDKVTNH